MIKTMFAFGALTLAVAAPAAAQMAAGALPKCSATVRDSCDQSMTTEKYALTADQAMKTGGVGDRKSDTAAKPMAAEKTTTHHVVHHHVHHVVVHDAATTDVKPM
jgi:hypothetical protein